MKKIVLPIFCDETLLQQFCTVELQCLVLSYAVVNEDVHAPVLPDDVAQGVADLVTKGWHSPGPRKQFSKTLFSCKKRETQMESTIKYSCKLLCKLKLLRKKCLYLQKSVLHGIGGSVTLVYRAKGIEASWRGRGRQKLPKIMLCNL